jgi:methyl-accepting chemotaxis protein
MSTGSQPESLNPNRRRQYYIKRPFQRRFITQFSGLVILGCVTFALALYIYSSQTLTTAFIDSRLRVMRTADFLLPALFFTALVVTTVIAVAAALRLLLLSHQIAGPLYRLEKTAEAIGGGNLNLQVRLRSKDELQDFAEAMSAMIRDLRTQVQQIKNQNERLKVMVERANKAATLPQSLIKELKDAQGQLDQAVNHFQV